MPIPDAAVPLFERVQAVVAEVLRIDPHAVKPQSRFVEDLGADYLDKVSLLMAFEDEFKEEISELEAQNLDTVDQAVALMVTKIGQVAG